MKNIWTGEPTASMERKIKKKLLEYKIYMILRPWESEEKREREGKELQKENPQTSYGTP